MINYYLIWTVITIYGQALPQLLVLPLEYYHIWTYKPRFYSLAALVQCAELDVLLTESRLNPPEPT